MPDASDPSTVFDASALVIQVVLLAGFIVGLILWLVGQKLLRVGMSVSGLVIGGVSAWVLLAPMTGAWVSLGGVVVGAVAGCVAAWVMFRIWMGMTIAVLGAGIGMSGALLLVGAPEADEAPTIEQLASIAPSDTEEEVSDEEAAELNLDPSALLDGDTVLRDEAMEQAKSAAVSLRARLNDFAQWTRGEIGLRWEQLTRRAKITVAATAIIGAVVGMLIGLLMPKLAAAVQTAAVGAGLMVGAAYLIVNHYQPEQATWIAERAWALPLAVGLITMVGVIFQWAIFIRSTDK